LQAVEKQLDVIQAELKSLQLGLPNLLHATVPDGADEAANVELRAGAPPDDSPRAQGSRGDRRERSGWI